MVEVIRARLLVRLSGVLIAGLCLPFAVRGLLASFMERFRSWDNGNRIVYFYSFPINIDRVATWAVANLVPLVLFLLGMLLVWRGSRRVERRFINELTRA